MKTILVVDDELAILEMLRTVLEVEGYRCLTAGDGDEGLALITVEVPDLVITDVMMPRLDGRALVRALRADPRLARVPVVIMSAAGGLVDAERANCDAFLQKPFPIGRLLEEIARLLEGGEGGGTAPRT